MDRNVSLITDLNGNKIVVINDIIFKGKRSVNWHDVEKYLKQYAGEFYEMADSKDVVYIGSDLPDEYSNSNYTKTLKGANAKAKANAAQGLPEMIQFATDKEFEANRKERHNRDAKFGWYRYISRFALPVFDENGEIERYNVFHASLLIRHAADEKMYLYDIMAIKKKRARLSNPKILLSKNPFLNCYFTLFSPICQDGFRNLFDF